MIKKSVRAVYCRQRNIFDISVSYKPNNEVVNQENNLFVNLCCCMSFSKPTHLL